MTTNTLRATDQIADLKAGAGRAPVWRERTAPAAGTEPRAREGAFAAKLRGKLRRPAQGAAAGEKPDKQPDVKKAEAAEGQTEPRTAGTRSDRGEGNRPASEAADAAPAPEADGTGSPRGADACLEAATDEARSERTEAARSDGAANGVEQGAAESAGAKAVGEDEGAAGEAGRSQAAGVAANAPITIAVVNRQLVQADPRLLAKGFAGVRIATASTAHETERSGSRGGGAEEVAEREAAAQGDAPDADVAGARQFGRAFGPVAQGSAVAAEGTGVDGPTEGMASGADVGHGAMRETRPAETGAGGRVELQEARLVPEGVGRLDGGTVRADAPGSDAQGKGLAGVIEGVGGSSRTQVGLRLRAEAQPGGRAGQGPPDFTAVEAQVSRGMAAVLAQRGGTVALRLQPAALGELRVQLDWERGSVSVRFVAASEKARGLLEQTLPGLRASLEARGLEVVRVAVESPGAPKPDAATHAAPPQAEQGLGAQGHAGGGQGGTGEDRPWSEQSGPARSAGNAVHTEIDALGPEAGAASTGGGLGPAAVWAEPGDGARLVRLRVDAWA